MKTGFQEKEDNTNYMHGYYKTKLHQKWRAMRWQKGRADVCPEWEDFTRFKDWALRNGYTEALSIDRIDSCGIYEPSNCQFITMQENRLKESWLKMDQKIELHLMRLEMNICQVDMAKLASISIITLRRYEKEAKEELYRKYCLKYPKRVKRENK